MFSYRRYRGVVQHVWTSYQPNDMYMTTTCFTLTRTKKENTTCFRLIAVCSCYVVPTIVMITLFLKTGTLKCWNVNCIVPLLVRDKFCKNGFYLASEVVLTVCSIATPQTQGVNECHLYGVAGEHCRTPVWQREGVGKQVSRTLCNPRLKCSQAHFCS